jgi:hypothetical protein
MKKWDGRWGIISPHSPRMGPDEKVHQGSCAVFEGDCCSCGNDGRGGRKRRPRGDDGGTKVQAPAKREREMA